MESRGDCGPTPDTTHHVSHRSWPALSLLHLAHTRFGRSGKATMRALSDIADANGKATQNVALEWGLQLALKLLEEERASHPTHALIRATNCGVVSTDASLNQVHILAPCYPCTVPPVS
jgi:hypothetical protein